MKPLEKIVDDSRAIAAEAQKRQAEVQAELEKGQREIAEGKDSTGSPLHDGLIVLYGRDLLYPDSTIVANYEKVAKELLGKAGEPVVMIHRRIKHEGCSGFGGELTPTLATSVSVGILEGEELVFSYDNRSCALPTSCYVSDKGDAEVSKGGLLIAQNNFSLDAPDLGTGLDTKLSRDRDLYEYSRLGEYGDAIALTIAVGHAGIAEWLSVDAPRTTNELLRARRLCEKLKIEPIEPATEWQKLEVQSP